MENYEDLFEDKIEHLIFLFDVFKEKSEKEGLISEGDMMFESVKMLVENYRSLKNNFPDYSFFQENEALFQLVDKMIDYLQKDLNLSEVKASYLSKQRLAKIDNLLKNPDIDEAQMNKLLDERLHID